MMSGFMNFITWFAEDENKYANVFTIITVVASAVLSLIISAFYFHKGNRENAKISIIYPITKLLNEGYSKANYDKLCEISQSYSVKYLKKDERKKLKILLDAYEPITKYDEYGAYSGSLTEYFLDELEKNGINTRIQPYEHGGEVDYICPQEILLEMSNVLEDILKKYDLEIDMCECKDKIISTYEYYCSNYFHDTSVKFFKNCSVRKILDESEIQKEWNRKFENANNAKKEFLQLRIVEK